jgi:hypothetical protein
VRRTAIRRGFRGGGGRADQTVSTTETVCDNDEGTPKRPLKFLSGWL